MKRHKENCHPNYQTKQTKRNETPYHMQLTARLLLDNLCYQSNKEYLLERINYALDHSDELLFQKYSLKYKNFVNK